MRAANYGMWVQLHFCIASQKRPEDLKELQKCCTISANVAEALYNIPCSLREGEVVAGCYALVFGRRPVCKLQPADQLQHVNHNHEQAQPSELADTKVQEAQEESEASSMDMMGLTDIRATAVPFQNPHHQMCCLLHK